MKERRRKLSPLRAGGLSATLLVVLLLWTPVGAGAHGLLTISAPYTAVFPLTSTAVNLSATGRNCAQAHEAVPAAANAGSGIARISDSVSAGYCQNLTIGEVTAEAGFIGSSFSVPTSGSYSVNYLWKVTWNISNSCVCRAFPGAPYAGIFLIGDLYDNTSKAWLLGGSIPSQGGSSSAPNMRAVVQWSGVGQAGGTNQTFLVRVSGTLTAGHNYLLFTALWTDIHALGGFACGSRCTAHNSESASVDVGSRGHGAWLLRATIS